MALLAPELKPGQRGYEKQQKMFKRLIAFLSLCSLGVVSYLYNIGAWSTTMSNAEHFLDVHRRKAEEIKNKKATRDFELLKLAEIRKKNAELYPPLTSALSSPPDDENESKR